MSEELPDLDVLESIHAAYGNEPNYNTVRRSVFLIHALYIAILLVIAWPSYYGITYVSFRDPADLLNRILIAPIILVSWFLIAPGRYFYFETSPEGFLARSFFGRRFIPWANVERPVLFGDKYGGWIIDKIVTSDMALRIPKYPGNWQMLMLQASIKQHLRKMNKVEDFQLPRPTKLLWRTDQSAVEKDIDWTCPRLSQFWMGVWAFFLVPMVIVAAIGAIVNGNSTSTTVSTAFVVVTVAYLIAGWTSIRPKRARRVRVNKNEVVVDTKQRSITLGWPDIKIAYWDDSNEGITSVYYLKIGTDKRNTIMLPYSEDFKESKAALLAIINRLNIEEHPELLGAPDSLFA